MVELEIGWDQAKAICVLLDHKFPKEWDGQPMYLLSLNDIDKLEKHREEYRKARKN